MTPLAFRSAWRRGDLTEADGLATGRRQRARVAFVRGRYREALELAAGTRDDDLVVQAWLHLDHPDHAVEHLRRRGKRVPADLAERAERPLGVELAAATVLPFADTPLSPYLPAVDATLDGHHIHAHLDTGGPFVVLGTQRAERLGLASGLAHELRLGGAVLTNVPVVVLPRLQGDQDVVVIGTNVLQRFLATIDQPGKCLRLAPRGSPPPEAGVRIRFGLWSDHFMFVRGDHTLFVDSGLVLLSEDAPPRQAGLYTWRRLSGPLRLGELEQTEPYVARGKPLAGTRSLGGIRVDGVLCNGFLRHYAWTLDFDRHEYTFRAAG